MLFCFKSNRARTAITLTMFVFGLLIVGLLMMPGAYAAPTITLNPMSGPAGTTVHISGSGFTPNGQINSELWNGTSAYSFTADANGNLNTTTTVPNVEPGLYGFIVTDASSQGTTQTQFTVTQTSTSPTPTTTSSTSPSSTPTVPELQLPVVVLTLFLVISSLAISIIKRRKTVKV
jgi:hypothetical protein